MTSRAKPYGTQDPKSVWTNWSKSILRSADREVRGTVHEVYGYDDDLRVVVLLTPELSGYVVDEPTTVVWPIAKVKKVAAAY